MKRLLLLPFLLLFALSSCNKDDKQCSMVVVKNCTGNYLQIDGKNYLVCNDEKLGKFADGETVHAIFRPSKDCPYGFVCEMNFPVEGNIKISLIAR